MPMHAQVSGTETLGRTLARRASEAGDSIFLTHEDLTGSVEVLTYAEMDQRASQAANLLASCGLRPGDSVHVHLWNRPEFLYLWLGAARHGARLVPTNPLLTADELGYVIDHARCRLSITEPDLIDTVAKVSSVGDEPERILVTGRAGDRDVVSLSNELSRQATSFEDGAIDPLEPVSVLYTSGTTSRPKGVLVTHANYLYAGEVVAQHLRMQPEDRMMIALPLFHANAQYYSVMSALVSGSSIVVAERFSASRWAGTVARHGATLASLFAAPIRMLLAQPRSDAEPSSRLRAVIFSQNVTPTQVDEFERRFGCRLLQLYGMTETIAPPTLNPLYGERRNMSIGRPTLGARLRVVDEGGHDVRTGEVGELLVAGEPSVTLMAGYLNDPRASAEALRDGYLHTGDNVRIDADGYLHFVDRAKDMIKRAGENISTGEVEGVVNSHPDVFESAVVGVPDEFRDEAVKAFVVLKEGSRTTPSEIIEFCSRRLAKFKVPGEVELLDSLPRTSVGKIRKEELRKKEGKSEG